MSPLNIAIIGGGPAGLTLANLLLASPFSDITVTIFERDADASARTTKGGTLDLRADTGLAALEAAGLRTSFDRIARYDPRSSSMVFANRHGTRVFEKPVEGTENAQPEIDRDDLRTLLLDALPEGTIRWAAHVSFIAPDGALLLSDGTQVPTAQYDLVVGADGAWSKARAHISDTRPVYSGISAFEMHIATPDTAHPALAQAVGHGLFFALGGGRAIIGQRIGAGDAIMVYAAGRTASATATQDVIAACGGDLGRVQAHVKAEYEKAGWAPELCEWIGAADPGTVRGWPLYEYVLPDGHVWEHRAGWTLVGDAAHVMTPFAGEGVNAAMRDALELARRIEAVAEADKGKEGLDQAVREYEEEMFARLRVVMTTAYENKESRFNEGAPESFLNTIRNRMGGRLPGEA